MLNFKMKLSKAMVSMVLLTAACLPFTVASAAAATGEWWEMTTKMDMPGMSATPQATPAMDPRIAEQTTEMRKKMAEMMKKMTPEQRVQAEAQMAMMEQSMAGGRMGAWVILLRGWADRHVEFVW